MHLEDGNIIDLFFADSSLFEKEGRLYLVWSNGLSNDDNDNLNSYKEIQCFCRLRGNLLLFIEINGNDGNKIQQNSLTNLNFYSSIKKPFKKTIEQQPLVHLIILNNFTIKLSPYSGITTKSSTTSLSSNDNNSQKELREFSITLNSGRLTKSANNQHFLEQYHFRCESFKDCGEWIKSIYLTSFRFLRNLRDALSEDLNKNHHFRLSTSIGETPCSTITSPCSKRIIINCNNVQTLCNTTTTSPSLFVKVFIANNLQRDNSRNNNNKWQYLGCTEVVCSQSPHFVQSIPIANESSKIISEIHDLKFELFNLVDDEHYYLPTNSVFLVAYAYFRLNYNHNFFHKYFNVHLKNSKTNNISGVLRFRIVDEEEDNREKLTMSSLFNDPICHRSMFTIYDWNQKFLLEERMQDSRFVFTIPQILLKSHIQDEKRILSSITKQSHLISGFPFYNYAFDFHQKNIDQLSTIVGEIRDFPIRTNQSFRPSRLKKETYLQFVPINFHKQTCQIKLLTNDHVDDNKTRMKRTIYSFGAYACHAFGFERYSWKTLLFGGQTDSEDEQYRPVFEAWSLLKKLFKVIHNESLILDCLTEVINHLCEDDREEPSNDQKTGKIKAISSLYHQVECISDELIDLISSEQGELLINHLNTIVAGQRVDLNYSEECQLEPIDLIYLNIKASFVDIQDKLQRHRNSFNLREFEPCNKKLRNAIASLRRTVLACYLSSFSHLITSAKKETSLLDYFHDLKFRHLSLITQALTTMIISIMDHLMDGDDDDNFLVTTLNTKTVLVMHESLLSCFCEETGMLEDMIYALQTISNEIVIVFKFSSTNNPLKSKSFDDDDYHQQLTQFHLPEINFNSDKINLVFHLNPSRFDRIHSRISTNVKDIVECKLLPLLFNVGINEKASLPNSVFKKSLQEEVNESSYVKLKSFIENVYFQYKQDDSEEIGNLLRQLQTELQNVRIKNIRILELACQLARKLNAIKTTCCKSAKDRSGMSVTLEEVRFAFEALGLKSDMHTKLFQTMLDTLRKDGVRIENVAKNIGIRKYAFNYICLLTFPVLMRPPPGTYSNVES